MAATDVETGCSTVAFVSLAFGSSPTSRFRRLDEDDGNDEVEDDDDDEDEDDDDDDDDDDADNDDDNEVPALMN
jgi:hypothetical protein